jgi:hypothetical protein
VLQSLIEEIFTLHQFQQIEGDFSFWLESRRGRLKKRRERGRSVISLWMSWKYGDAPASAADILAFHSSRGRITAKLPLRLSRCSPPQEQPNSVSSRLNYAVNARVKASMLKHYSGSQNRI